MILFKGNNLEISSPNILINGSYKDFGYGFYLTISKNEAIRASLSKRGTAVLNTYKYKENLALKILKFSKMNEEWLNFLVDCNYGKKHSYDIVEGPFPNFNIRSYFEDFLENIITYESFLELIKLEPPAYQIAFCSQKSLSTLTFMGSKKL
ncbi:MAG: DUF3990 domain-containing protein [Succinivibrionaceae bacterium]|nr:DUF3990 domain-containing protein [Succinivibrionaceae bacterium]